MVDVVTNHMAYASDASSVDYSVFNPFNEVRLLPLFRWSDTDRHKESYFHPACDIDYDDATSITTVSAQERILFPIVFSEDVLSAFI